MADPQEQTFQSKTITLQASRYEENGIQYDPIQVNVSYLDQDIILTTKVILPDGTETYARARTDVKGKKLVKFVTEEGDGHVQPLMSQRWRDRTSRLLTSMSAFATVNTRETEQKYGTIGSRIGGGSYGDVYQLDHDTLPFKYALKVAHFTPSTVEQFLFQPDTVPLTDQTDLTQELKCLIKLHDKNGPGNGHVLHVMHYASVSNQNMFMWTEKYDMDLHAYLQRTRTFTNIHAFRQHVLSIVQQLLSGLEYAHGLGVVHGDFKFANCLVRRESRHEPHVVIADWGLGQIIKEEKVISPKAHSYSTRTYRAPELYRYGPSAYDGKVDMFALGACIFELFIGPCYGLFDQDETNLALSLLYIPTSRCWEIPGHEANHKVTAQRMALAREVILDVFDNDKTFYKYWLSLLQFSPSKRPSAKEDMILNMIIDHPGWTRPSPLSLGQSYTVHRPDKWDAVQREVSAHYRWSGEKDFTPKLTAEAFEKLTAEEIEKLKPSVIEKLMTDELERPFDMPLLYGRHTQPNWTALEKYLEQLPHDTKIATKYGVSVHPVKGRVAIRFQEAEGMPLTEVLMYLLEACDHDGEAFMVRTGQMVRNDREKMEFQPDNNEPVHYVKSMYDFTTAILPQERIHLIRAALFVGMFYGYEDSCETSKQAQYGIFGFPGRFYRETATDWYYHSTKTPYIIRIDKKLFRLDDEKVLDRELCVFSTDELNNPAREAQELYPEAYLPNAYKRWPRAGFEDRLDFAIYTYIPMCKDLRWSKPYAKQLMEFIRNLHARGFVHGKLTPDNLYEDSNGQFIVGEQYSVTAIGGDFTNTDMAKSGFEPTLPWERYWYTGCKATTGVDMYAFGALWYWFVFGEALFQSQDEWLLPVQEDDDMEVEGEKRVRPKPQLRERFERFYMQLSVDDMDAEDDEETFRLYKLWLSCFHEDPSQRPHIEEFDDCF